MSEYNVFQKNFPLLLQHSALCLAKSIKRSFSLSLTLFNKVFRGIDVNSLSNLMCILYQYHDRWCISWSHRMWILLVILFALTGSLNFYNWLKAEEMGSTQMHFLCIVRWEISSANYLFISSFWHYMSFNRTFSAHQLTLDITDLTTGQPKVDITECSLELFAQIAIVLIRLQRIGVRYQKYSLSLTLTSCG